MLLPRKRPSSDFLLLTPTTCRYGASEEERRLAPADLFEKRFVREFGYAPPDPIHLAGEVDSTRRPALGGLDDNSQILTTSQQVIAPHILRYLQSQTRTAGALGAFYEACRCSLKVRNESEVDGAVAARRDYWLAWERPGHSPRERRLEVGLVACQASVNATLGECHLVWWERETLLMDEERLGEIFDALCDDLGALRQGDPAEVLALAWSRLLEDVFETLFDVYAEAADKTNHLYENPFWERYYADSGQPGLSQAVLAHNHHPESGRWRVAHGDFVEPDEGREKSEE